VLRIGILAGGNNAEYGVTSHLDSIQHLLRTAA
jgi:hypothetical protein